MAGERRRTHAQRPTALLVVGALWLALGGLGTACDDEPVAGPAGHFRITAPGTGDPASGPLLPLRPGYFARDPGGTGAWTAHIPRALGAPDREGVPLILAGPDLPLLRHGYVLVETPQGLAVKRSGEQIFDPPWLLIPHAPRHGQTWEVRAAGGEVLAEGRIEVTAEPGRPRVFTVHLDAVRRFSAALELDRVRLGVKADDPRRPVLRPVRYHPCAGGYLDAFQFYNPLAPDGGPLAWRLVEGQGFEASGALVPDGVRAAAVAEAHALPPPTPLRALALDPDLRPESDLNIWNLSRVEGLALGVGLGLDVPSTEAPDAPRLHLAGLQVRSKRNSGDGCDAGVIFQQPAAGAHCLTSSLAYAGLPDVQCVAASHVAGTADGDYADTPTRGGYVLTARTRGLCNPTGSPGSGLTYTSLHGAALGVFQAADGTAQALAVSHTPVPTEPGRDTTESTADAGGAITHLLPLYSKLSPEIPACLDPDLPAVGLVGIFPPPRPAWGRHVLDGVGPRVGVPAVGTLRRVVAAGPERAGVPLPLFLDAFPWVGQAALHRDVPPGRPAGAYFPNAHLAGVFTEPLSLSLRADGTREVLALEYEGAVRAFDFSGPRLRWRSLGRPRVPQGVVLVGAWRAGDTLTLLGQAGAVFRPGDGDDKTLMAAAPSLWSMPVTEGPWEDFPADRYPGVDVIEPAVAGERVVCPPPGLSLDADAVALESHFGAPAGVAVDPQGVPALKLPTAGAAVGAAGCLRVVPDQGTRDLASLARLAVQPEGTSPVVDVVRFEHPSLGPVRAWGTASLVPLEGARRVPQTEWAALAHPELTGGLEGDHGSLATPLIDSLIDLQPRQPRVVADRVDGHWIVDGEHTCGETETPDCVAVRHAPGDGSAPTEHTVSTHRHALPEAWPVREGGVYFGNAFLGRDGRRQDLGPQGGAGHPAHSAPDGPRPPGRSAGVFAAGETWAPLPLGALPGLAPRWPDPLDPKAPPPPPEDPTGPLPTPPFGPDGADPWRGVQRHVALPAEARALFEVCGGPLDDDRDNGGAPPSDGLQVSLRYGPDRLLFRRVRPAPGSAAVRRWRCGGSPYAIYSVDVFGRAVELLAAGVTAGDETTPAILPHPALLESTCGCDETTETCAAGVCVCAPEHRREGGRCVPVLGGSYRPAWSCAAIARADEVVPDLAYIDLDGSPPQDERLDPLDPERARNGSTVRARCAADGLTERLEAGEPGGPSSLRMLVGAFHLDGGLYSLFPFDPFVPRDPPAPPPPPPIVAFEHDNPAVVVDARLRIRVRSEVTDLGPVDSAFGTPIFTGYGLRRDAEGRLCVLRGADTATPEEIFCTDLDVSPLYFQGDSVGLPPELRPRRVATAGLTCGRTGWDHAGTEHLPSVCACVPRSCAERGYACGVGDDGCLGLWSDCGTCAGGAACDFGQCL